MVFSSNRNFDAFANRPRLEVPAVKPVSSWANKPRKTTEQLERELIALISKK
jgi:hypothetical protein